MNPVRLVLLVALIGPATAGGCARTFRSQVTQPNPLVRPLETLRESAEVVIVTGDGLPAEGAASGAALQVDSGHPLTTTARFTVVSRDRLRFHVQIDHEWQEWADVAGWRATLVDDQGRRYRPDDVDPVGNRRMAQMWDYETRSTGMNDFGDIVRANDGGFRRRQPLVSVSKFRGRGDFAFFSRDILRPEVKSLTLRVERSGAAFEFTWRFADDPKVGMTGSSGSIRKD